VTPEPSPTFNGGWDIFGGDISGWTWTCGPVDTISPWGGDSKALVSSFEPISRTARELIEETGQTKLAREVVA